MKTLEGCVQMSYPLNRLRLLREEKDLKQEMVAHDVGISRSALSTYEKGLTPGIDNAIALARYYGVSLDYILGLSDERNANIGALAGKFATLSSLSGGAAPTASDVTALVDAAAVYLANGRPCGVEPLAAWRDFMRRLTVCFSAATSGNGAQLLDAANAAVVAALDVTKMPAAMLEKKGANTL